MNTTKPIRKSKIIIGSLALAITNLIPILLEHLPELKQIVIDSGIYSMLPTQLQTVLNVAIPLLIAHWRTTTNTTIKKSGSKQSSNESSNDVAGRE